MPLGLGKRYLELKLANLNTADKAINEKLATATGKVRTQLFAAVTAVENKMRTVRDQIQKAIVDNRAAELALAVEVEKNAVTSAQEGTVAGRGDGLTPEHVRGLAIEVTRVQILPHFPALSKARHERGEGAGTSAYRRTCGSGRADGSGRRLGS